MASAEDFSMETPWAKLAVSKQGGFNLGANWYESHCFLVKETLGTGHMQNTQKGGIHCRISDSYNERNHEFQIIPTTACFFLFSLSRS